MKAILEFNLPEEKEEFETALRASKLECFLWEFENTVLRPARKYNTFNNRNLTEEEVKLFEEIATVYYELKNEQ